MAWGQRRAAVRSGIAECTPNSRASYDAAETTPRSLGRPPTTTALPLSEGSNNSSTDTKNASMSTWKMVLLGADIGDRRGLLQGLYQRRFFEARSAHKLTHNDDNGTSDGDSRSGRRAPGTSRSGIGLPAKRRRQGFAIHRVHRPDQETRALSVAIPVSAYIIR